MEDLGWRMRVADVPLSCSGAWGSDLLQLRLYETHALVDVFVIVEASPPHRLTFWT